jgi:hypothetical protein
MPDNIQNYKNHVVVTNKKVQLGEACRTRVRILEKLTQLEIKLVSNYDKPSVSQGVKAVNMLSLTSQLEQWVSNSFVVDNDAPTDQQLILTNGGEEPEQVRHEGDAEMGHDSDEDEVEDLGLASNEEDEYMEPVVGEKV